MAAREPTDNELFESIKEKIEFIESICESRDITQENFTRIVKEVEEIQKVIQELNKRNVIIDFIDSGNLFRKIQMNSSYYDQEQDVFGETNYNPFEENTEIPKEDLSIFYSDFKNKVNDFCFGLLLKSKIGNKNSIEYAVENKIEMGKELSDWCSEQPKFKNKTDTVVNQGKDKVQNFNKILYKNKKFHEDVSKFFYKIINEKKISTSYRIEDLWKEFYKEFSGNFYVIYDEKDTPHRIEFLSLIKNSNDEIKGKLKEVFSVIQERGFSATLRAKNMKLFANLVDGFAQFLLELVGKDRKNLAYHKISEQDHIENKKPKPN